MPSMPWRAHSISHLPVVLIRPNSHNIPNRFMAKNNGSEFVSRIALALCRKVLHLQRNWKLPLCNNSITGANTRCDDLHQHLAVLRGFEREILDNKGSASGLKDGSLESFRESHCSDIKSRRVRDQEGSR
jgi:hypothetical protein